MNFSKYIVLAVSLLLTGVVHSEGDANPVLIIKDHKFQPEQITVPAGQKVKLTIKNMDSTPEEFESYEMNREKIIPGGKEVVVYLGPLAPGSYPFFGEFNPTTARGTVIAK